MRLHYELDLLYQEQVPGSFGREDPTPFSKALEEKNLHSVLKLV